MVLAGFALVLLVPKPGVVLACLTAIAGARLGTRLLGRLDEDRFRRISGLVILALGAVCVAKGVADTIGVRI